MIGKVVLAGSVLSVLVLLAVADRLAGAPLFEVNFGEDTPGASVILEAANSGVINEHPTAVGGHFAVRAADGTSCPGFGAPPVAVLRDSNTTQWTVLKWWNDADAASSGQVYITFELKLEDDPSLTRMGAFGFYVKDVLGRQIVYVMFWLDRLLLGMGEFSVPNVMTKVYEVGSLELDSVMEVSLLLNMDAGSYSVWIEGDLRGTAGMPASSEIARFELASGAATQGSVALDNFHSRDATVLGMSCEDVWSAGSGMAEDFNQDCYVDVDDLVLLVNQWLVYTGF